MTALETLCDICECYAKQYGMNAKITGGKLINQTPLKPAHIILNWDKMTIPPSNVITGIRFTTKCRRIECLPGKMTLFP